MKRLSMAEEKIIADLYHEILIENMTDTGVVGAPTPTIGKLVNGDDYATGDNRIPKLIGKGDVLTRKGAVKMKSRKKSKKVDLTSQNNVVI